jgi:hypothetical protein
MNILKYFIESVACSCLIKKAEDFIVEISEIFFVFKCDILGRKFMETLA